MAIAFDNSTATSSIAESTTTISFTITGSNPFLVVGTMCSGTVTGITYNGVALTNLDSSTLSIGEITKYWYLTAPATGTHDVVISKSTSVGSNEIIMSYTGVDQTTPIDVNGKYENLSSTSATVSLTTTVNNDWLIGFIRNGVDATAGANTALRDTTLGTNISGFDSNADISTGGTSSNDTQSTGSFMILLSAAIKPVGAVALVTRKTLMGAGI